MLQASLVLIGHTGIIEGIYMKRVQQENRIGLAVILMGETGPTTAFNLANLDEIASMYLAVKGFTAFMTGFERTDVGPGRIRGILQIPSTELYAVAFDHNMKGVGTEDDPRMKRSRVAIICLIATRTQLKYIRTYYNETENFLQKELKPIFSVAVLTETFLEKLKRDYNTFLSKILYKNRAQGATAEPQSLYEVSLLLSMPKEENKTARAIMELSSKNEEGHIKLKDLCELTNRKRTDEIEVLEKLIRKGLIIVVPHESDKGETVFKIR